MNEFEQKIIEERYKYYTSVRKNFTLEADKIMKAQQARGADFESGNLFKRAKALVPILVPWFISAFRIAQDLAMAMEARCYGGSIKRTRMNEIKLGKRDLAAGIIFVVFLAMIVLQRILM